MIEPAPEDRRFRDQAWSDNALFDFIKQSYLLTARSMQGVVKEVEGLDERTARKVDFYTRQFVDAMAPSNFLLTNPEVLRATIESGGENLLNGLNNLLDDLERGKGRLHIRMTDMAAFKIGENIAATPGKVVYQNDLMQLIQYAPTTETVKRRPLLIMPPWINKFYILDLRPRNSFIRWAVAQGHTVFVISWVNPDEQLAAKSFEDYMREGPLAALDAIEQATGEREVNAIGYCLGGTLLAATLAYMAAKRDDRIKSATYFVTMIDFPEAGELSVFIDEEQLQALGEAHEQEGLSRRPRHGDDLQHAARQRSDLVVRRQQLPARQGAVPVRPAVLERQFDAHAGGDAQLLSAQDVPGEPAGEAGRHHARRRADRSAQDQDAGVSAVDARGSYRAVAIDLCRDAALFGAGQVRAVGVRAYRRRGQPAGRQIRPLGSTTTTRRPRRNGSPARRRCPDSWWPDWERWVSQYAGGEVPARQPGDGKLKPIEDAPGSYVKVRAED